MPCSLAWLLSLLLGSFVLLLRQSQPRVADERCLRSFSSPKPVGLITLVPPRAGRPLFASGFCIRKLVGAEGFEPSNTGSKGRRLTAWPRPNTPRGPRDASTAPWGGNTYRSEYSPLCHLLVQLRADHSRVSVDDRSVDRRDCRRARSGAARRLRAGAGQVCARTVVELRGSGRSRREQCSASWWRSRGTRGSG